MVYIFDVIFSFILLTALYMKAIDYQDSRYEVFSYGFISYKYTGGLLILVLIVEAVLAMCFIFGKYVIQASLFTALLFIFLYSLNCIRSIIKQITNVVVLVKWRG